MWLWQESQGWELGVGSKAALPHLLDQPRQLVPLQSLGLEIVGKMCGVGRYIKSWGRACGVAGNAVVMPWSGGPRCRGTRGWASSGPPRLGPLPAGQYQDARAVPLLVLGTLRARGSRPVAPVPVFPEPAAWLMPWQRDGVRGGAGPTFLHSKVMGTSWCGLVETGPAGQVLVSPVLCDTLFFNEYEMSYSISFDYFRLKVYFIQYFNCTPACFLFLLAYKTFYQLFTLR